MDAELYYTAPPDECFKELQTAALSIWIECDDTYGYATEKINRVKDLKNFKDNFMYIVAMFDFSNQIKLAARLSGRTCAEVALRLTDGGQPDELNPFAAAYLR